MQAPPTPDLCRVESLVSDYCERRAPSRCQDALLDELCRKRTLINRLELDFARDAAALAGSYDEEVLVNPSAISWLMENCHMPSGPAASAVCVGENAGRLPEATTALGDGRIGLAHLTLIARTADAVEKSPTATHLFNETRLVAKAEDLSVRRFRTLCEHVRHEADRAAFLGEQLERRDWRTLELSPHGDGGLSVHGFLDAEGGAVVRTALDPLARRGGADDDRTRQQRYADALVELCLRALDVGAIPQRGSQRTHLQVTTSLETLLDLVGAPGGEMEFAGLVAGATVQRLACDATVTRVLLDSSSQVVDVGRSQRVVHGATRRALNIRDGECCWPGCDMSVSWTTAHHLVHWTKGGRTDLDNLALLCRRHHWSVHEGGWQIARQPDGTLLTISPVVPLHARTDRPARAAIASPPPVHALRL